MKPNEFISMVAPLCQSTKILPSITIAQAILESGWGESELAKNANALFGIKAANWSGKRYNIATKEVYSGIETTINSDFRAYDSWLESVNDHDLFLSQNSRYLAILGNSDYGSVAQLLYDCGYATDPDYPAKLVGIIEQYHLENYDKEEHKVAKKICLDAGHYGATYNTGGWGYYESARMWELHLLLKADLEAFGMEVVTTRAERDKDLSLSERGKKAAGCDMFISLHSNACGTEAVDYPIIYRAYDNKNGADTLARTMAKAISYTMGTVQEGKTGTRTTASGGEFYTVMAKARMTGCPIYLLIEHSFHTNEKASKWLLDDGNLKKLSFLLACKIGEYYGIDTTPEAPTDEQEEGDEPSEWAADAWAWAVELGLTTGENPTGTLTREQFAFMLQKFSEV